LGHLGFGGLREHFWLLLWRKWKWNWNWKGDGKGEVEVEVEARCRVVRQLDGVPPN